jgi:hypothetical protein
VASNVLQIPPRGATRRVRFKSKLAIGEIVARVHPLPDVRTSIVPIPEFADVLQPAPSTPNGTQPPGPAVTPDERAVVPPAPARPTTLTPLSPQRYKLQVTISGDTLEKLRRAKDLLGHVVAASDDDTILNQALTVLLDKLTRERCARTDKPRPGRPRDPRARRPSAAATRIVWERDEGRCKYTSPDGHRCEETRRVVPHHLDPWVLAGDVNSPEGYELRCQRHNEYESRFYFGKRRRGDGEVREQPVPFGAGSFSTELVRNKRLSHAARGRHHTVSAPRTTREGTRHAFFLDALHGSAYCRTCTIK